MWRYISKSSGPGAVRGQLKTTQTQKKIRKSELLENIQPGFVWSVQILPIM